MNSRILTAKLEGGIGIYRVEFMPLYIIVFSTAPEASKDFDICYSEHSKIFWLLGLFEEWGM